MKNGHELVAEFCKKHGFTWAEFVEWADDGGIPEAERNVHDSALLAHLEAYRDERASQVLEAA
jgi:hypothetical protein